MVIGQLSHLRTDSIIISGKLFWNYLGHWPDCRGLSLGQMAIPGLVNWGRFGWHNINHNDLLGRNSTETARQSPECPGRYTLISRPPEG